jgi:cytochrome c oxidase assembly protein subunit 11
MTVPNAPTNTPSTPHERNGRNLAVAAACGLLVGVMTGAAFAAVPLYNWFCRVTGFAGTTQVASAAPGEVLARKIIVRFDANVSGGLPWRFEPETNAVEVQIGDTITVNYTVTNLAARETIGQASYNVSPPTVGAYFSKINCFCFTEQRMKAGETREMTVVFYVDPAIVKDRDQDTLNTITLSYTFYRMRDQERPVAETPAANSSKL